ncbi:zinc finger MYM-type protein 1-like [Penaeus indicus]|uniref:zinc finger MYM-type protein 1-like n=1 Tax=Penaeus indicus TaxID=29960 RepID=UPI00300D44A8
MASSTLRDPATENVVNIDQVLALGPIQPVIDFPATKFGGRDYRFQKKWYSTYDWLEYSVENDAMYCFYCRIFGTLVGCAETPFIKEGSRNWKNALGKEVRHIALQNEAFRGHDEKSTSLNQGKFLEEIKFLAKYHAPLQKWLDSHPENVSWLSNDIQNEMISIISDNVVETIREQVKKSRFYSVECDEVTSHKDSYMSIVLRYVHEHTIYERVVGLKHVQSLKGKSLSDVLIEELGKHQIPLKDMIGKGFDGASNMSGKDNGMQQKLTEAGATMSLYFHCFAHRLNLVLGKCAETLPMVKDVFETIGSIFTVMEGSPQRMAVYEENLKKFSVKEGRTALRAFSDTRWTARADNLAATVNTLPALIATLEELKSSDAACEGLLIRIGTFEFLLKVLILKECFDRSRYASEYLQREEMDMVTAVDSVTTLIRQISSLRTEQKLSDFVQMAKERAAEFGIVDDFSPPDKRRRTLPSRLVDGQTVLDASFSYRIGAETENIQAESQEDTFRRSFYYTLLDLLLNELQKRFSSEACEVMVQLSALCPSKWNEANVTKIKKFASRYDIPQEAVGLEYSMFRDSGFFESLLQEIEERKAKMFKNPYLPLILKKFSEGDLATLYPNLFRVIQIAATIPVTIASCERCHSKVKIINNYLRAKMDEDRIESLLLISSERDLSQDIKLVELVNQFAIKPRKLRL